MTLPKKIYEKALNLKTTLLMFTMTLFMSFFSASQAKSQLITTISVGKFLFKFENLDFDEAILEDEDVILVAQIAWAEQRQSRKGMESTVEIIHNRVSSPRTPDNIRDVIFQKSAFTSLDTQTGIVNNISNTHRYRPEAKAYAEALVISARYKYLLSVGEDPPHNHTDGATLTYTPGIAMCAHIKNRECKPSDMVPRDWNFELIEQTAEIDGSLYFKYKEDLN